VPTEIFPKAFGHLWRKNPPEKQPVFLLKKITFATIFLELAAVSRRRKILAAKRFQTKDFAVV
jgi:hypothetical protein